MATPSREPVADDLPDLLARASRGDEPAWRALVGRYGRRVYALARSRLGSPELAEDITQSVFVTVAERLRDGAYDERGRFEPWLFRIAANRVRDEARRAARRLGVESPEAASALAAPEATDDRPDDEELCAMRRALERLPDADREVVELRHHAGLAFAQIAELVGEPVGTLLARHHRALRKLRDLISDGDHAR